MPNLAQMFATVNAKTSFSRKGEIYSALSEGGWMVYAATLKENSGFFLKFDTSTIVLTPGHQDYLLPADLTNIVNLAERQTSAEKWRTIEPTGLREAMDNTQSNIGWDGSGYGCSELNFYGPYLTSTQTAGTQTQSITITPSIQLTRMCEIAYTAKWLPITSGESVVMLPEEGTYAMQNYAIAEINRANDDTLSREYEAKGDKHLTSYLTWVRGRQSVQRPQIESYGD